MAAPSIAALALGLSLTACGAGNESGSSSGGLSGTLKGAGSSAQQAAMTTWIAAYQTKNSGVTINYDPSGSGAGITGFTGGSLDFAASDAALDPTAGEVDAAKKRCGANALEVPDYVSPIAVIFNLDGVKSLNLDAATVAKIFDGSITKWNDSAIAAANPGVKLPSSKINTVHRSDDSGTTDNFTDYLSQAAGGAWTSPASKTWPLKSGEGANGTSGVVAAVKAGSGSIAYADNSQAGGLSVASIKVGDTYTAPSADGAAKALDASPIDTSRTAGDLAVKVDRTTTAAGAYPLMLTSYLIACPTYSSASTAKLVKGFLSYVVSTDGQSAAASGAGSAPLPASLQTKAAAIVAGITSK
ncbi:MAG TPA: phosphate ABC transporter substrate-binding protein PstS [Marmoricola sp.]|nr:phosphate ABC transporter substrate-binding protein PstS [Marmoricola sp.]